jgi:hypothetical protein
VIDDKSYLTVEGNEDHPVTEDVKFVRKIKLPLQLKKFHVKSLLALLGTVCSVVSTVNLQTKSIKSQTKPIK